MLFPFVFQIIYQKFLEIKWEWYHAPAKTKFLHLEISASNHHGAFHLILEKAFLYKQIINCKLVFFNFLSFINYSFSCLQENFELPQLPPQLFSWTFILNCLILFISFIINWIVFHIVHCTGVISWNFLD